MCNLELEVEAEEVCGQVHDHLMLFVPRCPPCEGELYWSDLAATLDNTSRDYAI